MCAARELAEAAAESYEQDEEALDILFEISALLDTGLERETLAALLGLCELGVAPEALATAVQELRADAADLRGERKVAPRVPALPRNI